MVSAIGAYAVPQPQSKASPDKHIQMFFGTRKREVNDFADYFAPALQKLGRLKADEMYGFVPALALGGPSKFENLEKLKAIEHLVLLAQLSELEVLTAPSLSDRGRVRTLRYPRPPAPPRCSAGRPRSAG